MPGWNPFQPPEDALPPDQIKILELRAEPWPEQRQRIRVHLELTPFLERPNLDVTITEPGGNVLSSIYIIETIEALMTFTMHLKNEPGDGPFSLNARLFYPESATADEKSVSFDLPAQKE